ncbi:hypothetical protein TNCV_2860951 [Trichonephila clavipes]|nr:hypothetical protein TNCV_2860951 [Trichonephila clavipes]
MKMRVLNPSRQNDRLRVVSVLVHIAAITPLHTPMPVSRRIGERTVSYSWRSCRKNRKRGKKIEEKRKSSKRRGLVVLGSGKEDSGVLVRDADQES